jgi:hypothetical protein
MPAVNTQATVTSARRLKKKCGSCSLDPSWILPRDGDDAASTTPSTTTASSCNDVNVSASSGQLTECPLPPEIGPPNPVDPDGSLGLPDATVASSDSPGISCPPILSDIESRPSQGNNGVASNGSTVPLPAKSKRQKKRYVTQHSPGWVLGDAAPAVIDHGQPCILPHRNGMHVPSRPLVFGVRQTAERGPGYDAPPIPPKAQPSYTPPSRIDRLSGSESLGAS